jgi:hypothetical protein
LRGHPLSSKHEACTTLDLAIAQSNLFFDQSWCFLASSETEKWINATKRLAEAIEEHDFSGILLVSRTAVNWIIWLSEKS